MQLYFICFYLEQEKERKGKKKNRGYHHEFRKEKRISNYGKLDVIILTILSRVAIKFECPIRSEIHTDLAWYAIGILQSGQKQIHVLCATLSNPKMFKL